MTNEQSGGRAEASHTPAPSDRESTVIRFRQEPLMAARDPAEQLPHEDPYQQLLDTIYDAVLVVTVTGHIADANLRSVDLLLYDLEELRKMRVINIIAGSDVNLLPTILASLDRDKFAILEAKCIRKDGSRFSAEIAASRIFSGGQTKLFFFIRDLTVRKQAERALRETLSRLEKQDRARALLVSNVTHELRTPLTSIMYGLSNLLSGVVGALSPQVRQYIERFDRECQRLLSTVEDILYLERIETRTLRLSKVRVPAARLAAKSAAFLELQARHKGIALVLNQEPGALFADCDPPKMERVLLNVIGNAIKYTQQDGRVAISTRKRVGQYRILEINVEDTGVGIPAHAIENVMDRYYRVGERADGAGLGLAIAKEIAEMHGGGIQITSPPPGKSAGTLVSVGIPSADPPDVLVLGQNQANTTAVLEQLALSGYRAVAETSSEKATARIVGSGVDLLIVDFPLSDSDGTEMIATLRGDERGRKTPIVVMAGSDLTPARKEIFSCLSIAVMASPWKPGDLLDCIERAFVTTGGTEDAKPAGV